MFASVSAQMLSVCAKVGYLLRIATRALYAVCPSELSENLGTLGFAWHEISY
jgi:hypothetical protein